MKSSPGFILYLIGLSMLGFLATDMYLPAFNMMQFELNTSANTISASLSLFLAGFAVTQLVWGPLSDRVGRRPVLLLGLSLFALGCLGIFWVTDPGFLLFLRFLQAVGVCSAAVCWQALLVDRFPASQARRVFATVMPLVALSPALAPLVGAWLLHHFSWRAIFALLLFISLLLLIPTLRLRETPRCSTEKSSPQPGFFTLLCSPVFSGNVLMYAACSASFFAWLTGSPFILGAMGYGPDAIGLSYIPQTLAFLVGGYGCRSALLRVEGNRLLPGLLAVYAFSILTLFLVATLSTATLLTLLLPFCLMALANGALYPIIVANALLPFPQHTGKAAALQNTLQLGLCAVASMLVSLFIATALLTTVTVMLVTVLLAFLGYFLQRETLAHPTRNPATHSS